MSPARSAIRFQVDGRSCSGRRGESLLDALRRNGFEVPSLCHLPGLPPAGACRLCLVEVIRGGRRKLTTSCNYPLIEGLEVELDSERVQRHRRMVLELLLGLAPRSDRLRRLAARYGVEHSRFVRPSDPPDCILCGLCARICRRGARAEALAVAGRGRNKRLAARPFGDFPESCIGCGACAWVCPTGAIEMESEAVARLRSRWGHSRPCRYALLGLLPGTVCENDYDCSRCEVDQRLVDAAGGRHPVTLLLDAEQADQDEGADQAGEEPR